MLVNKWQGNDATFLKGLDKVASKLKKLRDNFTISSKKQREKLAPKLSDYQTEEDIQNAYVYAEITEDERIVLLLLLKKNQATLTAEDAAVFYMNALLRDLRLDREDWIENMERKKRENMERYKRKMGK